MSEVVFFIIQFIVTLWPLFILAAFVYCFQVPPGSSRRSRKRRISGALASLGERLRRNLLATWTVLLIFWIGARFAPGPTPSILPEPWNTGIFLGGYALLILTQLARLGFFSNRLRARIDFHRAEDIQALKGLDPYAFEALITETYRTLGYQVQHVGHSGDHGVDVELRNKEGQFWIVQCKRYNGSVGESVVRDLYGTMTSEKADRAVLVTTAEITEPARAWARGKPIELVDGRALVDLIAKARDRANGTLLDRLAHFMEGLLMPPAARPAGLQVQPALASVPAAAQSLEEPAPVIWPAHAVSGADEYRPPAGPRLARPAAMHPIGATLFCPRCGSPMVVRPPRPTDRPGRMLFRCSTYPACRAVIEQGD